MVGSIWKIQRFPRKHYVIIDPEEGFYISGPFPLVRKVFATYGQALAALGHALDLERDKIEELKTVPNPRRFVKVAFEARGLAGVAYVLELTDVSNRAEVKVTYHVLCRGLLGVETTKDEAMATASDLVNVVSDELEAPVSLDIEAENLGSSLGPRR